MCESWMLAPGRGSVYGMCRGNGFWEASPAFCLCGCIRERSEDIAVRERNNGMVQIDLPQSGIPFQWEILAEDFIEAAIVQAEEGLFAVHRERFTHVILNPPYKKISGESATRQLLYEAGFEVSNLYAAFVWLSAKLLGAWRRIGGDYAPKFL